MSADPLLKVEALSVAFQGEDGWREVVQEIGFQIERGETLALVGESGSGKSVTAHSILQLLPQGSARNPSGSVWFDKVDLLQADEATLNKIRGNRISMIFQEPMSSLNPLHRVGRQIGEVILAHQACSKSDARAQTLALLQRVGFDDASARLDAYPHRLSGGQRQRVMIALALANSPDLLIADEPTTALDVTIQADILALLKQLQDEDGLALLLITHDLGVVRHVADKVCVMTQGRIVEHGAAQSLFAKPQHEYTKKLLGSEPKGFAKAVAADAPELIRAEGVSVSFPVRTGLLRRTTSHFHAVREASFALAEGETLGLVGESGSGKSTLGRAVLKLQSARGSVAFAGKDLGDLPAGEMRALRSELQIVFQDPFGSLNPRLSVGDIVGEGLRVHAPDSGSSIEAKVAEILEEVGLPAEATRRYPHEFSGGQRQRIAIARAMILQPRFVVLDEPTSALDMTIQLQIIDLLRRFQEKYKISYLFISHDLKVVRALAHKVMVMKDGHIVEQGDAENIFNHPKTDYTKALLGAAFDLTGS